MISISGILSASPFEVFLQMRSKSASGLLGLGFLLHTDLLGLALTGTSSDLLGMNGSKTSLVIDI